MASVEDVESGAEFERIRQNFRSTVVAPDVPANFPEAQSAFQELQHELQEFLAQHISRVASLQRLVSSNFTTGASNGIAHEGQVPSKLNRITRTSMHLQPSDAESPDPAVGVLSNEANYNHGGLASRHSSVHLVKPPVDAHMQALQAFLNAHMENIRALQSSVRSNSIDGHGHVDVTPYKLMSPGGLYDDGKRFEGLTQHLNTLVIISTFTAVLIVTFLSLINAIIGLRHQTAFNIGMLFAFFALSTHMINIIIAGRGARIISHHLISSEKMKVELDPMYLKFYITIVVIMTFLIFSSLAIPLVLMFVTAIGATVIFASAYWKVPITLENTTFLAKNIRRLGWRTLDYIKIYVRTPGQPHA